MEIKAELVQDRWDVSIHSACAAAITGKKTKPSSRTASAFSKKEIWSLYPRRANFTEHIFVC